MAKKEPLHDYEITLDEFRFPARLPGRKANFRLIVELRYQNKRGDFDTESAVLPGLDAFWECQPGAHAKENFVRPPPRVAASGRDRRRTTCPKWKSSASMRGIASCSGSGLCSSTA